ncbi:MAG: hypothetical protein ABIL25_10000 [candidate division WOR-3 bacterium]
MNSPKALVRMALLAAVAVFVAGCATRAARPGSQTVTVFISSWAGLEQLPAQAAVVRSARSLGPCVWLLLGNVFSDHVWAGLADGEAEVVLLSAAGVDAVVFGPEWLEFGFDRMRWLVDRAGFYILGANVSDSLGGTVGHPFMLKRYLGTSLGLLGVWLDSTDYRLGLVQVKYAVPDFVVRKVLPLIRPQTGLVGVAVRPLGDVPKWNVDFLVGAERDDMIAALPSKHGMTRLSLVVSDGRVTEYARTDVGLDGIAADSRVTAVLDSIRTVLDSAGAVGVCRLGQTMSPAAMSRVLVKGMLRQGPDGFLSDGELVRDTISTGLLTTRALIEALVNPGRLAMVRLSGQDLKALLEDKSVSVEWRTGLRGQKLVLHRQYSMTMTLDFYARHSNLHRFGYELAAEPLWRAAARILARTGQGS